MAKVATTLSLTPDTRDCLDRIARYRFGRDASNKWSQVVKMLLVEECRRIGVVNDDSQERANNRPE